MEACSEVETKSSCVLPETATTQAEDDNIDTLSYISDEYILIFTDFLRYSLHNIRSLATAVIFDHPLRSSLVLVTLVAIFVVCYFRNRKSPPGPWPWPFVGHVTYLLTNPHFRLTHLRDVYGDVYQLRCGGRKVVVVSSLDAIMEGLEQQGEHTAHRPEFESYQVLCPGHDRQLGMVTGDWTESVQTKKQFLCAAVDAYCTNAISIEDKVSSEIVETLNVISDIGTPFDPALVLDLACLNVSLNLTFSQRFSPVERVAREILNTYKNRSTMLEFRAVDFLPFLKAFTPKEEVDIMHQQTECLSECFRSFLNLHKDTFDPTSVRDFTDHLLLFVDEGEDSGMLQNEDIDYLLFDMAGYGFQEVAVTLTWMLGYMALNQDVQEEVHKELDSVVGRDRLPCLDDQPYLPLTMAAICETQRLASVRPFLIPHRNSRAIVLQGLEVPADSVILFNVWGLHHDPRYWPNPSRFSLDRFLNEEKTLEIPDHFLPYGAGPRQCPGESLADVQLFLFFSALMHQLRFLPASPSMALEGAFDHLLRPKPFLLTVTERDSKFSSVLDDES